MKKNVLDNLKLLERLLASHTTLEIEAVIESIREEYGDRLGYKPVGNRDNNFGQIQIGTDPGKAIVERLTNSIDAKLELEFERHNGRPQCNNPRDAAYSWLDIPTKGSYLISATRRRELAKAVKLTVEEGNDKSHVNILIIDQGAGIKSEEMESTILNLGGGNKVQKPYLMGAYGQGGSSTFAYCKYSVICSRPNNNQNAKICFTIVFYEDLPPEQYKHGRFVYLTIDNKLFEADPKGQKNLPATMVKHYGYDLAAYRGKLGPYSLYGLLQRTLFDPVIPIMLDDKIRDYRRVIKGARNALNAAADEEIEERGPNIRYSLPQYNIDLGDFETIGLEYWVLEENVSEKKYDPIKAYVDNKRPILFTLNGQTHAEFPVSLIKSEAQLPFLRNRLIVHVDCNNLSHAAKRNLFSSNREEIRKNEISIRILSEIVKSLKSDDQLKLINEEARNITLENQDIGSEETIRKEVAKLLHLYGFTTTISSGGISGETKSGEIIMSPPINRPPRPTRPKIIELHDPPTYVKILNDSPTTFYKGQRRYIRIESDAISSYHDSENPTKSKFNFIPSGKGVKIIGSTPLKEGRLRLILDCDKDAEVGMEGELSLELSRFGLPTLTDRMQYRIIDVPISKPSTKQISVPRVAFVQVDGKSDPTWERLEWSEDETKVAVSSDMNQEMLTVYYSLVFPPYRQRYDKLLRESPAQAEKFNFEYKKWLALHSILIENDKKDNADSEEAELREMEERSRLAILASMTSEQFVISRLIAPEIE